MKRFFLIMFILLPLLVLCVDSQTTFASSATGPLLIADNAPPPPCAGLNGGSGKCISVDTGVGTISTDPALLVRSIFTILLSISGSIAILLIVFGGYRMMTSQGNPERVQGARETVVSAIIGLLFTIFSLVILEIIGVDILHLAGFSHK